MGRTRSNECFPVVTCSSQARRRVENPVFCAVWAYVVEPFDNIQNLKSSPHPLPAWSRSRASSVLAEARWAETGRFEGALSMTDRSLTASMGQNGVIEAVAMGSSDVVSACGSSDWGFRSLV